MEASPLVQQARPPFQPKVVQLYQELFQGEDDEHSLGFWSEFFLLKPDRHGLSARLDALSADDFLHRQHESQQLFSRALQHLQAAKAPSDEVALDTLTVFLIGVLSKRYTNPSSDIITVLAGLDAVDSVFSDFANAIEVSIRTGRTLTIRAKAIEVALSVTSGAYQTSLVSYFTYRDLFPALMKYVQDLETDSGSFEAFLLLGLLANYNKFEFRNLYRLRLEDFVNETIVQRLIKGVGETCSSLRSDYTILIDDLPVESNWSLANTLNYIGLGIFAPIKAMNPLAVSEDNKEKLALLPSPKAAILLSVYDFVHANKVFSYNLVNTTSKSETPFGAMLSFASYILHHAYRSPRTTLYGVLSLSILRILIEDPPICKRLCDSNAPISVRLCRQRAPTLPPTPSPRAPAAQILDIAVDTINHNLRRRLDFELYTASLLLIHRILVCLAQNHIHLPYHWSLLWQSLLSLLRFLQTYAADLTAQIGNINLLIAPLLKSLTISIAKGNSFLADPASYDDLFYKLVEHADALEKFKTTFKLSSTISPLSPISGLAQPALSTSSGDADGKYDRLSAPIDILVATAAHFHAMIEQGKADGKVRPTPSAKEVSRVIRDGYESLSTVDLVGSGVEMFDIWREGEERGMLKKVARTAVEDGKRIVATKS